MTRATALDLFAAWDPRAHEGEGEAWAVPFAAAEVVWVLGETDVARGISVPERADIRQLGAVLQGGATRGPLTVTTDVGLASGDGNPFDARQNGFTMDRDYRVGLIMFREYLAAVTAAGAFHLADPESREVPSDGAELLPTGGGVRNAWFVQCAAEYVAMQEALKTRLGLVWARAHRDAVDPFASFISGGTLVGLRGGDAAGRNYGFEMDLSARYIALKAAPRVAAVLHSGVFFPGDAFADPTGRVPSAIHLVTVGVDAGW
jgi:hypothetical protein